MAATDKPYRDQRVMDIVFAVSCVAMLLSCIWMFADDYYREYKPIQRKFRDVETALSERQMINDLPDPQLVEVREKAVVAARQALADKKKDVAPAEQEYLVKRDNNDTRYKKIKADLDAKASYYNIAMEHVGDSRPKSAEHRFSQKEAEELKKEVKRLEDELKEAQATIDATQQKYREEVRKQLEPLERDLANAEEDLKRITAPFDRFAKSTAQKTWTVYDSIRTLPILDGFASPTRINQIHLNDLTIEYGSFKDVPRYDRCTTCHLGIERATFNRDKLDALSDEPYEANLRLRWTRKLFNDRKKGGEKLGFDLGNLPRQVSTMKLTPAEVTMYAAHPRLDLFVDANSPHPAEKVGCTICHNGQGSATSFGLAAHSPADFRQEEEWRKEHGWAHDHFWDFPMLSSRFVESTCLKCHHQVTDLVRHGSKEEAPKLLRGYNLVREMGCFGCHEIAGLKSGKEVGPDLRLEPSPALEWLSAAEQEKAKSDPANPPGTYRKVGPSLRRLAEKTNPEWVHLWINSPRGFRPDTRMPHFYNLSNNSGEAFDENTGTPNQKAFPATEIHCVTAYLFEESSRNLKGDDTLRKYLEHVHDTLLKRLLQEDRKQLGPLNEKDKKALDATTRQLADLALLSVPAKAARINVVATELKQAQDRLQDLLQAPEAARRKLQQQRQLAKSRDDTDKVKEIDRDLADNKKTFEQAVGLGDESLAKLTKEFKEEKEPAKKKKLEKELLEAEQTRKDRRLSLTGLAEELRKLSLPTPISEKVVSWDGTVLKELPAPGDKKKVENGRRLFIEKGCMACHSHEGTTREKEGPVVNGEANFGPNLSRLAAKLGIDSKGTDARRWLLQWILNPNVHHPRTRMPITQLSKEDATDIADWLLSQKVEDWKEEDPAAEPRMKDLKALTRVYLLKAPGITREEVQQFLGGEDDKMPEGIPDSWLRSVAPDAEEHRLAKSTIKPKDLKWYVGKKAITRLGCFGCHDTPGFDQAKPIGVALNDWGKKDPERLAFEDAPAFLRGHFNVVASRNKAADKTERDPDWKYSKDGKPPLERFFAEGVEHHTRDGFLNLKLEDPRSYDYQRLRTWDDRLRMPQFRFARHVRREKDEVLPPEPSQDASEAEKKAYQKEKNRREERYQARLSRAEAEAREAVMTFILGLVAEPIPLKYQANPKPDKLAETKGRQVLEKFNCAGCHQVRSGVYEFYPSKEAIKDLDTRLSEPAVLNKILEGHSFMNHNAWVGTASPYPDRMLAMGTLAIPPGQTAALSPDPEEGTPEFLLVRLSDALRFTNESRMVRDYPAGEVIRIPLKDLPPEVRPATQDMSSPELARAWVNRLAPQPYGGTFRSLLTNEYAKKAYSTTIKTDEDAFNVLPPPLIREGERVQPNWLYQFLLKPHAIRPQVLLRMPQFNMSADDATALVNYFTAVERLTNGSAGNANAFLNVEQQDKEYWQLKNEEYVKKLSDEQKKKRLEELKPIWELVLQDQVVSLKPELAYAEKELEIAREEAKKTPGDATKKIEQDAQKKVDDLKKRISALEDNAKKKDFKALNEEWEKNAYAADAYRLLLSHEKGICRSCHSIGNLGLEGAKAPPLDKVSDRLRPEWTRRWIAAPAQMYAYNTTMPANFLHPKPPATVNKEIFDGSTMEQIMAVRDVLLNFPRINNMPVNRYYRPAPAGGK